MGEEDRGFVIKDRRQFTSEGAAREQAEEKTEKTEPKAEQAKPQPQAEQAEAQRKRPPLPEVTFSTFILSLVSSALVNMGEAPNPGTGATSIDLVLAKHTIDMIAMIKDKTKGNLSDDEQAMIDSVLYDLRMRYVAKK